MYLIGRNVKICAKTVFIVAILVFALPFNNNAQPNSSFENWSPEGSYEIPEGWQTLNFLSLLNPPNPISTFKASGNDKHSGNYALRLKTVYFNNNPLPDVLGDTAGGAFTGKAIPSPFSYHYGFPYTGRPEKIEFWCKYAPIGNDTAGMLIYLQKWNNFTNSRDTIALSRINISTLTEFELFQVDIAYNSLALPDTATIIFASSKDSSTARVGSSLYLDDVTFTGWVGIDENNCYAGKVKLFPNPARDNVTISTEIEEAENVKITDISGKIICEEKIQDYKVKINTAFFAESIYFYEISDKKQQVLAKGKFNVIK